MKEIKFRVWDKITRKYHYNWLHVIVDHLTSISDMSPNGINPFEDPLLVFEQYTGLKDKNGKEIYEGDIVKVRGTKKVGEYVTIIVFNRQGFELLKNKTYLVDNRAITMSRIIEVIGNIHENPELNGTA